MSPDWHWIEPPRVFVCLYRWRRWGRAARRPAVEVQVGDMTAFLNRYSLAGKGNHGFSHAAVLKSHGSLLGLFLDLSSGAILPHRLNY